METLIDSEIGYIFAKDSNYLTIEQFPDADKYYWLNLKCEPNEAQILRDIFPAIIPGYHMNKTHWNTIILDGSVPDGELERLIDLSHRLVGESLAKYKQKGLIMT